MTAWCSAVLPFAFFASMSNLPNAHSETIGSNDSEKDEI
jgi:hypothetical protein